MPDPLPFPAMFLTVLGDRFEGFHGLSLALLASAAVLAVLTVISAALRTLATRPRLPDPAPATRDLRAEPPAIVNLLVHRWVLTPSSMPATMLDLAARRWIEIDQLGDSGFVVRIRPAPPGEALTAYESQILDWIRARATGGSAPLQALALGEPAAAVLFWNRFRKAVETEALATGLARNRWAPRAWVLTGWLLLTSLASVAGAFALARLGQNRAGGDGSIDPWTWFAAGAIAWLVAYTWLRTRTGLRDTPAGLAACAHWLGVRTALASDRAFDNLPPAAVVLWERYLSYGAALGLAHDAVRPLPFTIDDPETAWARRGPTWHEIRIAYPTRFGFGRKPSEVLLQGLGLTAGFGFAAFFVLPVLVRILVDALPDILNANVGERWLGAVVAGVILFATVFGAVLVLRLVDGVFKLFRGLADLAATETVEGVVVNMHQGRIALDTGEGEETNAYAAGACPVPLGARVRLVRTPRLWYVKSFERLDLAGTRATAGSTRP